MKEKDYKLVIGSTAYPHIINKKELLNNIKEENVTMNTINENANASQLTI
jgi:hypothetical protein